MCCFVWDKDTDNNKQHTTFLGCVAASLLHRWLSSQVASDLPCFSSAAYLCFCNYMSCVSEREREMERDGKRGMGEQDGVFSLYLNSVYLDLLILSEAQQHPASCSLSPLTVGPPTDCIFIIPTITLSDFVTQLPLLTCDISWYISFCLLTPKNSLKTTCPKEMKLEIVSAFFNLLKSLLSVLCRVCNVPAFRVNPKVGQTL